VRGVALVHPLAAAIVALCACLVAFRGRSSIYRPDEDNLLRLFPFDNRHDARIGVVIVTIAVLLVTVFARGNAGRRLRRALGLVGAAAFAVGGYYVVYSIRRDCSRWEGCDFRKVPFFIVDAVLLLLASLSLLFLAGREPGRRLRWFGAAAVVALAVVLAIWTYRATQVLRTYTGPELAGVRLQGFFETNQEFVPYQGEEAAPDPDRIPPAIPALPGLGAMMICGGDWRVVKFPDRDRCLPRRPMVSIQPGDVERIKVAIFSVGAAPQVAITFNQDAGGRFASALRAAGSFHFVLLNARGDLIMDNAAPWPVPGPTFVISTTKGPAETDRLVRSILDRP